MNDKPSPTGTSLDEFLGAPAAKPWYRNPKYLAAAVGGLILLLVVAGLLGGGSDASYATEAVRRGNLTVTVSATGNLEPTNQVEVGSEQSGLVDQVYVDNNDRVVKGQPLARLDPSRLRDTLVENQAGLAQMQAQVAQYRAALTKANSDLSRMEEVFRLSGGKVPARTELDNARAQARQAAAQVRAGEAQVTQARAQLSSAQTNLAKATIYSPVTGVVLSRDIDPGQTVAASLQAPVLFTLAEDLSQMELKVKVDEADVGQVKEGQRATFTVDAYPGRRFSASISRVDLGANASDDDSSTTASTVIAYTAVLRVQNPDQLLRPGMTATAEIVTSERKNVLLVPNAALRFTPGAGGGGERSGVTSVLLPRRPGGGGSSQETAIGRGSRQTLYVLGGDGLPQARQVVVGDSNGAQTEISSGQLKPGDQVITGRLAAGDGSIPPAPERQASLSPRFAILPEGNGRGSGIRANG